MTLLAVIILAIVEGITEFLPISSTGHLILVGKLLQLAQTDFLKSFEVSIQLGAILAVVCLYWKKLFDIKLWPKVIAAFLPTVVLGAIFYDFIKSFLFENTSVILAALFVGGIILLFIDKVKTKNTATLTIISAFKIGLFQALSMIPGVSRAAATIIGGQLVGLDRKQAVQFSFLLAVPTMLAATTLDLFKTGYSFSPLEWQQLGIGFVGAFITALITIKVFVNYISNNSFKFFGIYRIVLAIVYYLLVR